MNQSELADKLNYTKSSVSAMLSRDTWKVNELIKYANAIGYEVRIELVNPITGETI
jgi:Mn-dependent DtxR family transcriptional regulator